MELKDFINNTKVVINDELIKSIVSGYVNSNVPFYNEDKAALMPCLEFDYSFQGKVDPKDNEEFMSSLMLDMCYNKCHGKEEFKKLDKDAQVKMGDIFYRRIKKQIFECRTVVYDKSGINQDDDYNDMKHEFIIKVRPEYFIFVLKEIYSSLHNQDLSGIRIVTPSTRFICSGYNAPIRIRCNSEDLEKTLNFLDSLDEEIIDKTYPVHPVYATTNSWFGYQQFNENGLSAPALLSKAIYEGIIGALDSYRDDFDIIMGNGEEAADFLENSKNLFVATREILKSALIDNYDIILDEIYDNTASQLSLLDINMVDCLRFASVNDEISAFYSQELFNDMLFKQDEESLLEMDGIALDLTLPGDLEDENKDKIGDAASAEDLESIIYAANMEEKVRIEKRKAELLEIIHNSQTFRLEDSMVENLGDGFKALGNDEIKNDPSFGSVSSYSSFLASSLSNVLNGASPREMSEYNTALEEYNNLLLEEKMLDDAIANGELYVDSRDNNLKKDEENLDTSSNDKINQDMHSKDLENNISAISSSIDSAIDAIIAFEEAEKAREVSLFDLSKAAEPNFDPNKVITIPTSNLENIEGFASGKTEVLSDLVSDVNARLAEEPLKKEETNHTLGEKEEVNNSDKKKVRNYDDNKKQPERVNPDSSCLDYLTSDDVLVPDLRDVAYNGNDLIEAMKMGGNVVDFDNIAAIAKHFGMDDYKATKDQKSKLLEVLRNLDKYDMDGTIIGSGVKPFSDEATLLSSTEKENVKASVKEDEPTKAQEDIEREVAKVEDHKELEQVQAQEPEEFIQLTTQNLDIQYNPLFRDANKYKYSQYVKSTDKLDLPVLGTNYTVLDYFMYYDIFNLYKPDSIFVLHEAQIKIKGKEFTDDYLIAYLTNYGPEDFEIIKSYFVEEILPPVRGQKR